MSGRVIGVWALPGSAIKIQVDGWDRVLLFNARYTSELEALEDVQLLEAAGLMNVARHSAMATPTDRPTPIWAKDGMGRTVGTFNGYLVSRGIGYFVD